jgi:hypothetical protein
MEKEMKFSEMLHGDIRWMKQRDIVDRMHKAYIELITSDLPAGSMYRTAQMHNWLPVHRMGYGRGMQAKRKMIVSWKIVAEINKRHPALAAEHRVSGAKAERSIAAEMQRMRDWKKLNWALYYGRDEQWDWKGTYA